ncbi:sigma-54-dependent transcriptional regulator [Alteribacillus bidgolensis]|uniref:Two-component system, NtrC family, response regulator AtoC n=1 Tax=Alteribacillus bidgolensis TaxID=930129 RepID=A0A1G8HEQ9_9BACI|nr:sigma-54 dependent transcriptional regulator [Alteribacillus bidgolensis]SDI05113.1 two-component system, NtrC family, response regulator AtoC [Alteribacillus bidgolensis]
MANILIIDDEPSICASLEFALEDDYEVQSTTNPKEGLRWMKEGDVHLCLLDLKIGNQDGLEVLDEIKKSYPHIVVIMITAYGTIESSVKALQIGAYSYLTKPINMEELTSVVKQAIRYNELNQKVEYLTQELERKYSYEGMIGTSQAMRKVYQMIDKVKEVDTSVLITGESGTGKELVARAIHHLGKRKQEHFVVVNCAAIPESLLESELFGYVKGAFTGADTKKQGMFQLANNGTIFLDEIGDMSLALQAKLLRVLQLKEITPLGSTKIEKVNVRVIAATNRDLGKAVEKGEFREDLYFRLNVIQIKLPPLRQRKEDLPHLIRHFLHIHNKELGTHITGLSKKAEQCLIRYNFPGNVRELANVMEASMVIAEGKSIEMSDLPSYLQEDRTTPVSREDAAAVFVGLTIKEVEKEIIHATLQKNKGHRKQTADMLGISERSLRDKIKQYNFSG